MNERWIQRSERIIEQIKELEETKDRDRLELVRSLRFMLGALGTSLAGWMQWISNPDTMTVFSKEELEEMNKTIMGIVKSFIEYDIKMTNEGFQKGIKERRSTERKTAERVLYV